MAVEEFCAACGHSQKWHNDGLRKCNHMESLRPYVRCDCESFVSPEPSRRAAVDTEAVMDAVVEFGIYRADPEYFEPNGVQTRLAAIRAMLEPHDAARLDVVTIPRELAERALEAFESISEISAVSSHHKYQCAADANSMKGFLR